jgi:hypothetical protein
VQWRLDGRSLGRRHDAEVGQIEGWTELFLSRHRRLRPGRSHLQMLRVASDVDRLPPSVWIGHTVEIVVLDMDSDDWRPDRAHVQFMIKNF